MGSFELDRRKFMLAAAGAAVLPVTTAMAQDFPSKPIKVLVAFAPGGTTDTVARLYGQKLSEVLKQPVLIENKPGGFQLAAIRELKNSKPDGYTLMAGTSSALVQNPALRKNIPYDVFKDFTLISNMVTHSAVIFVRNDFPAKTRAELVEYAKAHPDDLNYAHAGIGSAGHLYAEAVLNLAGIKATAIAYSSDSEVVREIVAGNVQMSVQSTLNTVPQIKSGKIRALAVTTPERLSYLPDVPALNEIGIKGIADLHPYTFISLVGPAGLPADIVKTLNDAVVQVAAMPDVQTRVRETLFSEPTASSPEEFKAFIERQIAVWKDVGKTVDLPDL
jgi:tripartite-type tricarboxylate transporter receptor subunit TctC